ncbi:MAG: OFA family MFS transporter [Peptococcaceae bacterium]|nr:OFA family MFS transporter [Peptococcaceae bacterium]
MINQSWTRYSIVFAGFLLAFLAGVAYAWGPMVVPLVERFDWTMTEAAMPFTIFFLVFALVMVPAGRMQDTIGPKKTCLLGAVFIALGFGGAALVGHFPYPWWLFLTYGFTGGIGAGTIYACVAPPVRKWFPDSPAFAISCAVMGVGLAGTFVAPVKARYLIPVYGVEGTLVLIAVIGFAMCLLAVWIIKNPAEGVLQTGTATPARKRKVASAPDVSPREVLLKPIFWVMWLAFGVVIAGGMLCAALITPFGRLVMGLSATEAATAVAIFSGFNGFGRPIAGYLSDKFGTVRVMAVSFAVQAVTLFLFNVIAVSAVTLYMAAALVGWGLAVVLATFPALTAAAFGTKHLGVNYGLVFTSLAFGAFMPAAGAAIYDATGNFTPAFLIAGSLATVGVGLCLVLKHKFNLA